MRLSAPLFLIAAVAALPAFAQRTDAPLGEILEALPNEAEEAKAVPEPVRPQPRPMIPATGVGTMELPPSEAVGLVGAAEEEMEPALMLSEEEALQAEADALWAERQEQRRAEINAEEAPIVARLNERIAARNEAKERENEEARRAWERQVAALEAEARARDAAHQASLEAHRREVARQRAEHERRVQLCLAGAHEYCARRR